MTKFNNRQYCLSEVFFSFFLCWNIQQIENNLEQAQLLHNMTGGGARFRQRGRTPHSERLCRRRTGGVDSFRVCGQTAAPKNGAFSLQRRGPRASFLRKTQTLCTAWSSQSETFLEESCSSDLKTRYHFKRFYFSPLSSFSVVGWRGPDSSAQPLEVNVSTLTSCFNDLQFLSILVPHWEESKWACSAARHLLQALDWTPRGLCCHIRYGVWYV